MQRYRVSGMTCGHCASTVEKAVKSIDPGANVTVELKTGVVEVRTQAEPGRVSDAIRDAGYENQLAA